MEKIKTGIEGLDEILKGGLHQNSSILVTGVPGTGKTIFALQFLTGGAKNGEPGLFISSEEDPQEVIAQAESLGLNVGDFVKKGLLTFLHQPILTKMISFAQSIETIKKKKIKRVVLDSLTLFEYMDSQISSIGLRKEILQFISRIKESGATLLATSEREFEGIDSIVYKPQDFLFEGLIILSKIRKGASFERCAHVAKMRGQDHLIGIYPFQIEKSGIKVYPKQLPFSLIEKSD